MMNRVSFLATSFALAAALGACSGSLPPGAAADTVLLNGTILTVDEDDTVAQAVAIRDGRIVAVGTNELILELAGPSTRRVDLKGLTATPGLLDAHAHFASGGVSRLHVSNLSYPNVESVSDIVEEVAARAEESPEGEWVQGRGWDEGKLEELRYVYAADLDPISPENPVWLTHTMGHYGVANSLALRLAGIDASTPDPPGGTIDRHPDGTPSGVLKESAQALVSRLIPETTPEQLRRGIASLAKDFNAEGMTGVKDPGIGLDEWSAYQDVLGRGNLTVRVFVLWRSPGTIAGAQRLAERIAPFTRPYLSTGDDRLISGGVKLFSDGSGGARTAWLSEPWNKNFDEVDGDNHGYPAIDPELLRQQILLYHDAGLHVSTHSIGDRAIDWVVDSYAIALEGNPASGRRHGIIHANIPTDRAIDRMAKLQREHDAGYPEPSAPFMWWIGDTYAGNFGPERARRLNPFATYREKGVRWAGASDFSVTPFPARYGIWASVARETLLGVYGDHPYGEDEAVDVRTALRSYTIWSARQLFLEDEIGSIEPGKYADIAVWDRNPYAVPTDQLKELACQMTLLEGEIVFRKPDAPITVSES